MKSFGLLVVVCLAAVAACAHEAPVGGDDDDGGDGDVDPAFAVALAARQTPVFALPERPVTSIGRCAIEIAPRPAETRELVSAEFRRRTGLSWSLDTSSFDPVTMVLRNVRALAREVKPPVSLSNDEAVARTIDFVIANYELFGLSNTDFARVVINPGREDVNGTRIVRTVGLDGNSPLPGYEDLPALAQRWQWRVSFNRQGDIEVASATTGDLLPRLELCTDARIPAGDARLTRGVIGYQLIYADAAGQPVDVGKVEARDIGSIALTFHRSWREENTLVLRLAYAIEVTRSGLPWVFIIDADTAELIEVEQRFAT
jgi:hypothetical protein